MPLPLNRVTATRRLKSLQSMLFQSGITFDRCNGGDCYNECPLREVPLQIVTSLRYAG